jgi:hypothetical protein
VVFLGGFVLGGWRKMASLEKGGLWVKKRIGWVVGCYYVSVVLFLFLGI